MWYSIPGLAMSCIGKSIKAELSYAVLDSLEHWLRDTDIIVDDRQFDASVHLSLLVPLQDMTVLQEKLMYLGASRIMSEE